MIPASRKRFDRPYPTIRYVLPPYVIVSRQNAPGSATRNGTITATSGATNAAQAERSVPRDGRCTSSICAKNGTATNANCLSVIATASSSEADTSRRRERSAKASTRHRRLGASAVPNQTARTEREPQPQRPAEQQEGTKKPDGGEEVEQAIVVERLRKDAPRSRRQRGAGEVCEVAQRDLPEIRIEAGGRVPTLEAGARVVVAVGVVPVGKQFAGQLDLVGRVVDVVPRLARLAQPDLEQDGRQQEGERDGQAQAAKKVGTPASPSPPSHGDERDEHSGHDSRRADGAEIPMAVGSADEWAEEAVRVQRRRPERPRVRAQFRHGEQHQQPECREHRPPATGPDPPHRAAAGRVPGSATTTGELDKYAAPTASTSHVMGSSKKPL